MALYFGGDKRKLNLGGTAYRLNLGATTLVISGICLLSSDGYVLTDSNGIYLTVEEV